MILALLCFSCRFSQAQHQQCSDLSHVHAFACTYQLHCWGMRISLKAVPSTASYIFRCTPTMTTMTAPPYDGGMFSSTHFGRGGGWFWSASWQASSFLANLMGVMTLDLPHIHFNSTQSGRWVSWHCAVWLSKINETDSWTTLGSEVWCWT